MNWNDLCCPFPTMIDYYEFLDMDDRGKSLAIKHYGVFLLKRSHQGCIHKLFAIDDFYAETCHDEHNRRIGSITGYDSVDFLDPFLDQINLDDLEEIGRGAV